MRPQKLIAVGAAAVLLANCARRAPAPTALATAPITRGDITVVVQATGSVQPLDTVEIKSKASGIVTKLPVDVGTDVKAGDLLVQIDPHDVLATYSGAVADDVAALTALRVAQYNETRSDSLFHEGAITAAGYDSATVDYKSVQSDLVSRRASLDLARQALEEATIHAPMDGTILVRTIAPGAVIAAATGAGAGQTLLTMADLRHVQMSVTVDEVQLADVRVGEPAAVKADAFPDRTFRGVVQKIEPQAVVLQSVTFFPVKVSIDNSERLLLPGMNGEVQMNAGTVQNTLEVPIDGIRTTKELGSVARLFGMDVDSLTNLLKPSLVSENAPEQNFVVVAQSDSTYELRLVKIGKSNLEAVQLISGAKQGDQVVMIGAAGLTRPPVPPKLLIAKDISKS